MSATIDAPKQFSQPSRKGKKAWRKNIDVTEVQEGLRLLKDEEIKGGVLAEKPSEELFMFDSTGSAEVRKAQRKERKPLKCDEILAQRSAIPSLDTRKRASMVTDGVIEPTNKRQKKDWVSRKEWLRLKQVAKDNNPAQKPQGDAIYDPWAEDDDTTPVMEDPRFDYLPKPKPKVAPETIKHAPISLAANGKPIPAVRTPGAGTSYNPSFEEWDSLLQEQGQKEVEAEKKRLEEQRKEEERQRLVAEAQNDDGEVKSDDESAWEGFESEYEKPDWLNKKRPERKTKTQRNKIKRRKEAERQAKWEARMKEKEDQVARANTIAEEVQNRAIARVADSSDDESSDGDDTVLRRRPLGRNMAPEKPLEVVLPDELQDSLRLLKPEGNLLDDRFRTLIVQGKLESRKPIIQAKKAKRKVTEKWTYKDFKVPGME